MKQTGTFSADGVTDWVEVNSDNGVHITAEGDFGSGTITIQKRINGTAYPARDSTGTALTNTAAFDRIVDFRHGEFIRLSLASSTDPAIDYLLTGVTWFKG